MSDHIDNLDITDDSDLKCVEIDALVVMRIMKHCNNNLPAVSTGNIIIIFFDFNFSEFL